jgi:hypothetical protein
VLNPIKSHQIILSSKRSTTIGPGWRHDGAIVSHDGRRCTVPRHGTLGQHLPWLWGLKNGGFTVKNCVLMRFNGDFIRGDSMGFHMNLMGISWGIQWDNMVY